MPQMIPAIMGPLGAGLDAPTTTAVVSLVEAEVVEAAVPVFWVVGEGVDVEDESAVVLAVGDDTVVEELDTIVSEQVGNCRHRRNSSL